MSKRKRGRDEGWKGYDERAPPLNEIFSTTRTRVTKWHFILGGWIENITVTTQWNLKGPWFQVSFFHGLAVGSMVKSQHMFSIGNVFEWIIDRWYSGKLYCSKSLDKFWKYRGLEKQICSLTRQSEWIEHSFLKMFLNYKKNLLMYFQSIYFLTI